MRSKKVKDQQYYGAKNRAAWNAVTANHRDGGEGEHLAALQGKGGTCLTEVDLRYFREIGISGKRVAHVACNKGNELLSLVKLGARPDSVGFDISDEAVKYASDLSEKSGIPCQFERVDLYDIHEDTYSDMSHVRKFGIITNCQILFRQRLMLTVCYEK